MIEVQLSSPLAERAQELAAEQHMSVQHWVQGLIAREAAFYEMEKAQLRELLRERMAQAEQGLGEDIDTVVARIQARFAD